MTAICHRSLTHFDPGPQSEKSVNIKQRKENSKVLALRTLHCLPAMPSRHEDLVAEPPSTINPYQVLGIEEQATADEIKSAYRKKALQHHPGPSLCLLFRTVFDGALPDEKR
jgi:DnaJ-like protein